MSTIYCRINAFEHGQQSVKAEARSGRHREAVTPATIAAVEQLVNNDWVPKDTTVTGSLYYYANKILPEVVSNFKEMTERRTALFEMSCFIKTMLYHILQNPSLSI